MLAVLALMVAITAVIGGPAWWWLRRQRARFSSEGALAEVFADPDGPFTLTVRPSFAVDLVAEYAIQGHRMSGGGLGYGLHLLLEVRREGDPPFALDADFALGRAQPRGPNARHALETGPLMRSGVDVSRALVLLRVPAGGELVVRGRVEPTQGTCTSLHVFARPAR